MKQNGGFAFTLAEVLITLTIIGVVTVLVIPTVLKNYNDKKYNTARLKALKTFGEAGKIASMNGEINGQPTARAFVENILSKYLKIIKVCDTAAECNFPTIFKSSSGSNTTSDNLKSWNSINYASTANNWTDRANENLSTYVSVVDGFSAKIFYNPKCVGSTLDNPFVACKKEQCITLSLDSACLNIIYDMNGNKKPNHLGEDIGFVTTFWSGSKSTSVAPGILSYAQNTETYNAGYMINPEASAYCASYGKQGQYSLPSLDEISSIMLNFKLFSLRADNYWSGTSYNNSYWGADYNSYRGPLGAGNVPKILCVKR